MILHRISYKEYADLGGIGGMTTSGRWSQRGHPVVYLSQSLSLAAWEKFMQFESINNIPDVYVSLKVEVPDSSIQELTKIELVKGWDSFPHQASTRLAGTRFLKKRKFLLLKVPSAVIQDEFNYIMNPFHPLSIEAKIIEKKPFIFDERLKKK
ncbi:RES family NAD+ phosphorylase [uncultured Draconibacterium sp.]|uniref:RES family NAD+ phosphorylase n=1 Tax=uncultured Draconibacterium sp. TaxID=1573823 RepID=UPI0025D6D79C|nr:RES family NAD+ phosphorylase [uncultured Draconibacterium sp.]